MNQLISTQNGGIPLDWNDFRFEQAAVREAFYGILSAFGITPAQSFILSGCVIGGGSITAGYIAKGGEVYQVDAQAIPTPGIGQYVYFNVAVTYDPSGDETMFNGVVAQTYAVRKAVLALTTDATEMLLSSATPTIHSLITGKLKAALQTFTVTTGNTTVTAGTLVSATGGFLYKHTGIGMMFNYNAATVVVTGTPSVITIDLSGILPAATNGYLTTTGFATIGGSKIPITIELAGTSMTIKPLDTANFAAGTYVLYFNGYIIYS